MFIDKMINKFGYSEMYEWSELFKFDIIPFGRFVTFDNNSNGKIRLAHYADYIIGVTTINSVITSDNSDEWQGKYICNEFGDILLKEANENDTIIGEAYDIKVTPIIKKKKKNITYKKRSDRQEWIRVNLLGKCIVVDNGKCQPGKFCTIDKDGTAKPSDPMILSHGMPYVNNWYVMDRLSDNTIMIFFK